MFMILISMMVFVLGCSEQSSEDHSRVLWIRYADNGDVINVQEFDNLRDMSLRGGGYVMYLNNGEQINIIDNNVFITNPTPEIKKMFLQ